MNNIIHRPTASFTLHQEVPAGMALYNKLWPKSKCLSNHKANVEFLLTHTIQTDEYVNSKMMNSSLSSMCVIMCKFCFLFSNVSFSASFWSVV
jgi:ribulose kinase